MVPARAYREPSLVSCGDVSLPAWERIDATTVRRPLERLEKPAAPRRREVPPVEFVGRCTTAPV